MAHENRWFYSNGPPVPKAEPDRYSGGQRHTWKETSLCSGNQTEGGEWILKCASVGMRPSVMKSDWGGNISPPVGIRNIWARLVEWGSSRVSRRRHRFPHFQFSYQFIYYSFIGVWIAKLQAGWLTNKGSESLVAKKYDICLYLFVFLTMGGNKSVEREVILIVLQPCSAW